METIERLGSLLPQINTEPSSPNPDAAPPPKTETPDRDVGLRPLSPEEEVDLDQVAERSSRLLGAADLPGDETEETFDTFLPTDGTRKAFEAARDYSVANGRRGLVFAGGCGTGKGHLAHALLRTWIGAGRAGICQNVPDLLKKLRRASRPGSKEDIDDILDLLAETPLLVLQDLGAGRTTEFGSEQIYLIVDARERARLPLVATTNYADAAGLAEKLGGLDGERIVSRLLGGCDWHILTGPDYRLSRMRVVR